MLRRHGVEEGHDVFDAREHVACSRDIKLCKVCKGLAERVSCCKDSRWMV